MLCGIPPGCCNQRVLHFVQDDNSVVLTINFSEHYVDGTDDRYYIR